MQDLEAGGCNKPGTRSPVSFVIGAHVKDDRPPGAGTSWKQAYSGSAHASGRTTIPATVRPVCHYVVRRLLVADANQTRLREQRVS
jgi:hypothetical protein